MVNCDEGETNIANRRSLYFKPNKNPYRYGSEQTLITLHNVSSALDRLTDTFLLWTMNSLYTYYLYYIFRLLFSRVFRRKSIKIWHKLCDFILLVQIFINVNFIRLNHNSFLFVMVNALHIHDTIGKIKLDYGLFIFNIVYRFIISGIILQNY